MTKQTEKQEAATAAKIAAWKAQPLPYCITDLRYVGRELRTVPIGRTRFATKFAAIAAAQAYDARYPGKFALVDFAGAYA